MTGGLYYAPGKIITTSTNDLTIIPKWPYFRLVKYYSLPGYICIYKYINIHTDDVENINMNIHI